MKSKSNQPFRIKRKFSNLLKIYLNKDVPTIPLVLEYPYRFCETDKDALKQDYGNTVDEILTNLGYRFGYNGTYIVYVKNIDYKLIMIMSILDYEPKELITKGLLGKGKCYQLIYNKIHLLSLKRSFPKIIGIKFKNKVSEE